MIGRHGSRAALVVELQIQLTVVMRGDRSLQVILRRLQVAVRLGDFCQLVVSVRLEIRLPTQVGKEPDPAFDPVDIGWIGRLGRLVSFRMHVLTPEFGPDAALLAHHHGYLQGKAESSGVFPHSFCGVRPDFPRGR